MTGLPSKHSDPRILTLAGQVGACISGTMSATIVPSAVCTAGGAVFVFRPPGSGAGRDRSLQSRIRPPSAGRYGAKAARPGGTFGANSNGLDDLAGSLGVDQQLLCARFARRRARADHQHQLRRPCRGGSPSLLYDRLHPRSQVRRLRRGRPAGQSRLQARRRTLPVGRLVRRPERHKAAAANIAVPAIGGGLSQRKVLPPLVR